MKKLEEKKVPHLRMLTAAFEMSTCDILIISIDMSTIHKTMDTSYIKFNVFSETKKK